MGRISGLCWVAPEGGAVAPRKIDQQTMNVQAGAGEDRRRQPDRRHPTPEPPDASLDDDLLAMLRDEFDVDVDEMSANVLDALRGRPRG
jgi:hypothetical protein